MTLTYGDFIRTFDVMVTYYGIYFEGALYKFAQSKYKMGTNQNDLVRFQLVDLTTKTVLKASNLKVEPISPEYAVVDSYTDTECLVRIKKPGMINLMCYDTSTGEDFFIELAQISVSQ